MSQPNQHVALDADDGEMESTTLGVEIFSAQDVPSYPPIARLGRYDILGRLARGGMAEVYLARFEEDDKTVRHVVIKRVLSELAGDPRMLSLFVDEGRTALRLYHPNVCHVYEVAETNGLTYMVLEWVHGVSLKDLVQRAFQRGNLPVHLAVHVIAKVASALEYVHTARGLDGKPLSIIHQDVTPHNVMLSWRGHVKLLDFGIAKTTGAVQASAQGKHAYMAPEQIRQEAIDARADVFALGVCLHEALTGKKLFQRDGIHLTMQAVVDEVAPSVRIARPEVPEALDRIVQKALAKRREDRFQSAGELQRALEDWMTRSGGALPDVRVALTLGGYFSANEKLALPQKATEITGTFAVLTGAAPPPTSARASTPPKPLFVPKRSLSVAERLSTLSPGAVFGITVAVGLGLVVVAAVLVWWLRS